MKPRWIAVDWGTTNLRAWAMDATDAVIGTAVSDKGMGVLTPDAFEDALIATISPWLSDGETIPVVACGMVGARQGWIEARYSRTPTPPIDAEMTRPTTRDPRISVHIIAGVSQSDPADVMRGEETQIAGYIALHKREGTVCLPGTHSKWVKLRGGEIIAIHTEMTGELFALLTTHSVLRHSVGGEGWVDAEFAAGVEDGFAAGTPLPQLFSLRAASLLTGLPADAAKARLSGLLIGAELKSQHHQWADEPVSIIGAPRLSRLYGHALGILGGTADMLDADTMTLAGLTAANKLLKEPV